MSNEFIVLVVVIALGFAFDYINGFHDAANAIATVVSTNVLPPRTAILIAALFNFIGAFLGTGVAAAVGGDIADPRTVTQTVVAAALVAAIAWNLLTWYLGIPSSSSHTLIGGIVGAVLGQRVLQGAAAGATLSELARAPGVVKIVKGLILSPIFGFLVAFFVMVALLWIVRRQTPSRVNSAFRRLQLVSASAMALSHGSNDAQKVMGIVTMALVAFYSANRNEAPPWLDLAAWEAKRQLVVPAWVIVSCAAAIALGTSAGGWRIMKTLGHKVIRLRPIHGFAAETTAAIVLFGAAFLHVPVSTTHVISCSIMGVGSAKRVSAVRWGIAGNMLVAWVLTIPVTALLAALVYVGLSRFLGA